jgi:2'-5' RNA ligase
MAGIRSFVAIKIPDETRAALAALQQEIKARTPPKSVRWTRPESIHLTLQFLGDVAPGKVEAIADALRAVCIAHSPFTFQVRDLGVFPNPHRPRVVWVGVAEPSGVLIALQKQVTRALVPLGFEPERRAFKPHLTLGRASRHAGRRDLAEVGDLIAGSEIGSLGQVDVDHIILMKSDLRPSGAVYTPLAVLSLGQAAG